VGLSKSASEFYGGLFARYSGFALSGTISQDRIESAEAIDDEDLKQFLKQPILTVPVYGV
jgi:hypothetical protein